MYKFFFDREEELNPSSIGKIIRKFETEVKPQLIRSAGYFDGSGQEIMFRMIADETRPNNKIVKNYCSTIVDNFQGYLTGLPITYTGKDDADITSLQDILDANDVVNSDNEFLRNALVCGIAYQLCYVNEDKEKKFKNVDATSVIPIYSNDLDEKLLYVIYYFPIVNWDDEIASQKYSVNVYTEKQIFHYEAANDFWSIDAVEKPEDHYFGEVPFAIFNLNVDNKPIFERIISLQDAYNKLLSDEVNDFEAFVDAYMVLKNVTASADDLEQMKASRTILLDGEDDVSYLTKDISDTQIQNMLDNINTSIHTISNSPDFSSEEFNSGVSSGVALQFKLVGFNNIASSVEAQFKKAISKRIGLLNSILSLVDTANCDVEITFNHNLPTSIGDTVNMVSQLRGLVSDETLLAQIPFVNDVDQELNRVAEETNSKVEPYTFGE